MAIRFISLKKSTVEETITVSYQKCLVIAYQGKRIVGTNIFLLFRVCFEFHVTGYTLKSKELERKDIFLSII